MRGGFVADAWSVRGAVVSGGVACVVGVAATAVWLRTFWSYDARTDPYAVAEREARGMAEVFARADRRAAALLSDGEEERLKNMLASVRRAMAETEGDAR